MPTLSKEPQVIRKIEVKPVVPGENPYAQVMRARDVTQSKVKSPSPEPSRGQSKPAK